MFPKLNGNSRFTKAIVRSEFLASKPMTVFDVGAAGGFASYWSTFKNRVRLVGFEPNIDEYKKCAQTENEKVYPVALGRRKEQKCISITRWPLSSSAIPYDMSFLNRFPNSYMFDTLRTVTLETVDCDSFCREHSIASVDFMKVDTEGTELEIMEGAENLLKEDILGVLAEVAFCPYQFNRPLFGDIDLFLRKQGFVLFDLQTTRLARSALPPIETYIANPSKYGQVLAGDVLYLRDIVAAKNHPVQNNPVKIIKAVCLFEMFCFHDCAVELMEYALANGLIPQDLGRLLDLLVPPVLERSLSLKEYRSLYDSLPQLV